MQSLDFWVKPKFMLDNYKDSLCIDTERNNWESIECYESQGYDIITYEQWIDDKRKLFERIRNSLKELN